MQKNGFRVIVSRILGDKSWMIYVIIPMFVSQNAVVFGRLNLIKF